MSKSAWILFAAFAVMSLMQIHTIGQRDRAREDFRAAIALYNGVLAGRGCTAEPTADSERLKLQGLSL